MRAFQLNAWVVVRKFCSSKTPHFALSLKSFPIFWTDTKHTWWESFNIFIPSRQVGQQSSSSESIDWFLCQSKRTFTTAISYWYYVQIHLKAGPFCREYLMSRRINGGVLSVKELASITFRLIGWRCRTFGDKWFSLEALRADSSMQSNMMNLLLILWRERCSSSLGQIYLSKLISLKPRRFQPQNRFMTSMSTAV